MALFEMPSRHRNAGNPGPLDMDWLIGLSVAVAVIGLIVLVAIAYSNWRATNAINQARKEWNTRPTGMRRGLAGEKIEKPNPLRKINR